MEEWIKKSDAIKALNTEAREQFRLDDSYAYVIEALRNVEDAINSISSADRPQGEWILSDDRCWKTCSECGADVDVSISLGIYVDNDEVSEMCFCPNCGVRMKGAAL